MREFESMRAVESQFIKPGIKIDGLTEEESSQFKVLLKKMCLTSNRKLELAELELRLKEADVALAEARLKGAYLQKEIEKFKEDNPDLTGGDQD